MVTGHSIRKSVLTMEAAAMELSVECLGNLIDWRISFRQLFWCCSFHQMVFFSASISCGRDHVGLDSFRYFQICEGYFLSKSYKTPFRMEGTSTQQCITQTLVLICILSKFVHIFCQIYRQDFKFRW